MTWKGWNDDDAGIDGYTYQVYGLHAVAAQLQHASIITDGASAGYVHCGDKGVRTGK